MRVHWARLKLVQVVRQDAQALLRRVIAVEPEAGIAGVVVPSVEVLTRTYKARLKAQKLCQDTSQDHQRLACQKLLVQGPNWCYNSLPVGFVQKSENPVARMG